MGFTQLQQPRQIQDIMSMPARWFLNDEICYFYVIGRRNFNRPSIPITLQLGAQSGLILFNLPVLIFFYNTTILNYSPEISSPCWEWVYNFGFIRDIKQQNYEYYMQTQIYMKSKKLNKDKQKSIESSSQNSRSKSRSYSQQQRRNKKHKKQRSRNKEKYRYQYEDRHKRSKIDKQYEQDSHDGRYHNQHNKRKQSRKQKQKKKRRYSSSSSQISSSKNPLKKQYNNNQKNSQMQITKNLRHPKLQHMQRSNKNRGDWSSSAQRSIKNADAKHQAYLQQKQNQNQKPPKQLPNFQPSGILLQYYNAREGVSLKFNQPPEAHKPTSQWRIYPFKENKPLNPIILSQSCYLIGKDERICDILCENSSISRQHAVIQFRSQYQMEIDGSYQMQVKPYIMDLQSTNGTLLNDQKIEPSRYYQLLNKDVLKFGLSQRQYIMFKVPEKGTQNQQEEQQVNQQ